MTVSRGHSAPQHYTMKCLTRYCEKITYRRINILILILYIHTDGKINVKTLYGIVINIAYY